MADEETGNGVVITRRHALIGGAMLCASGLAYARTPTVAQPVVDPDVFEKWVPKRVGPWRELSESGVVLPPPDTLRDRLYDNLVTRVFVAPGRLPIMMLIAYNNAQDGVLQVHRPEVCYPVGGFELSPTVGMDLKLGNRDIPANVFTAVGPDRKEEVLYFTRLGDAFPRSWVEQRLAVVRANLKGDIPDGMMMRLSVLRTERNVAVPEMSDFAQAFFSATSPTMRRLLVG